MTATWTQIPDSDLDPNSPGKTHVFSELRNNLDALHESAMFLRFDEQVKTPAVANTFEQYGVSPTTVMITRVPSFGKKLVIPLQVKTASGTATFEARITTTGETSDQKTTTSATYERKELTFSDLSARRGAFIQIEIWGKSTVPASTGVKGELGPVVRWEWTA